MTAAEDRSQPSLILIVDDNEMNLALVRDVLGFKGYRTLDARTAEEGIGLARSHRPDLILMDIHLPGIDGITALEELRADPATASLKVVALTALAMSSDHQRLLSAGFDGYLAKPIDIRRFPEQVRQFCTVTDS